MLGITPDSFIFVYDSAQIAVCSATAVIALSTATQRVRHPLGTKGLPDFFVNLADCFIGDLDLGAASQRTLVEQAQLFRARRALFLDITAVPQ